MTDGIQIDPQAIAQGAADLAGVRDQVRTTAGDAVAKINAVGAFWGDDHVGQQFSQAFTGNASAFADGINQLVSALGSGADALGQQATQWRQAEARNIETAHSAYTSPTG